MLTTITLPNGTVVETTADAGSLAALLAAQSAPVQVPSPKVTPTRQVVPSSVAPAQVTQLSLAKPKAQPQATPKASGKAILAEVRRLYRDGQFDAAVAACPTKWGQVVAEIERARNRAGGTLAPRKQAATPKASSTTKPKAATPKASSANDAAEATPKAKSQPIVSKGKAPKGPELVTDTVGEAERFLGDCYDTVKQAPTELFAERLAQADALVIAKGDDLLFQALENRKATLAEFAAEWRILRDQDAFLAEQWAARKRVLAESVRRISDAIDAATTPAP